MLINYQKYENLKNEKINFNKHVFIYSWYTVSCCVILVERQNIFVTKTLNKTPIEKDKLKAIHTHFIHTL